MVRWSVQQAEGKLLCSRVVALSGETDLRSAMTHSVVLDTSAGLTSLRIHDRPVDVAAAFLTSDLDPALANGGNYIQYLKVLGPTLQMLT